MNTHTTTTPETPHQSTPTYTVRTLKNDITTTEHNIQAIRHNILTLEHNNNPLEHNIPS